MFLKFGLRGLRGSGKEMFYQIIVTQIKSYSLSRGVESDKPTNVKYIHYGDIHIGKARLLTSDLNLSFVDINMDYVPLKKGDLVLADASEDYIGIAECCVIDFDPKIDIVAGLHTIGIRPKIDQNPVFFYYNFKTDMFKKHCYRVGTGMKVFGITFNNLSKYDGCFPVKKEQTQIGDFFQKIDQVIELQQKVLDTARAYKQSMLQKMFPQKGEKVPRVRFAGFNGDWEQRRLSDIVKINPSAQLPMTFKYVDLESVKGHILMNVRKEFRETAPSRAQRVAIKNDIFYQTVRPYQRNNYLFDLEDDDHVFSTGYAQLRPKKIIISLFLFSVIQTVEFLRKVLIRCTGTSYPAINSTDLGEINISFPSLKEQTAIGNFFQKLDQQIEQQAQKLATYQQLKKAMLQRMFV